MIYNNNTTEQTEIATTDDYDFDIAEEGDVVYVTMNSDYSFEANVNETFDAESPKLLTLYVERVFWNIGFSYSMMINEKPIMLNVLKHDVGKVDYEIELIDYDTH